MRPLAIGPHALQRDHQPLGFPFVVFDHLFVLTQYLLPKQRLTALAGRLARHEGGALTTALVRWFVQRYGVDLSEALEPDAAAYRSFNEFFCRPLRAGARPIAEADFVCPVDGAISQLGAIENGEVFQAKGHHYSARALLGGEASLAECFRDGSFATLYLSPRDYHRIHMPVTGRLRRMLHIPGDLFSVNPATARGVPGLFARNERVVCLFDADFGSFAVVLVGATIVGSVATVWQGTVTPPRRREVQQWTYDERAIVLEKGHEMGRFLLGSTVVLLFPKDGACFHAAWHPGRPIRMGEAMASRPPATGAGAPAR